MSVTRYDPQGARQVRWRFGEVRTHDRDGQPSLVPGLRLYRVRITVEEVEQHDVAALVAWLSENVGTPSRYEWIPGDVGYAVHDCPDCCCVEDNRLVATVTLPAPSWQEAERAFSRSPVRLPELIAA
jgi:hypothetical protein